MGQRKADPWVDRQNIDEKSTYETMLPVLAKKGGELLLSTLRRVRNNTVSGLLICCLNLLAHVSQPGAIGTSARSWGIPESVQNQAADSTDRLQDSICSRTRSSAPSIRVPGKW